MALGFNVCGFQLNQSELLLRRRRRRKREGRIDRKRDGRNKTSSSGKDVEKAWRGQGFREKQRRDKMRLLMARGRLISPHGFNYSGPPGPSVSHGMSETWKNTIPRVPAT